MTRPGTHQPTRVPTMPNDSIVYLLKFASKEARIDGLMDRHPYMNAAGYYYGLPGEQGDSLETA